MAGTWDALMHMMRSRMSFFDGSTPSSSSSSPAQSAARGWRLSKQQPSESADSYFPERATSPTSSVSESEDDSPMTTTTTIPTIITTTTAATAISTTPAPKANRMIGAEYPIPPLEREYSPPTQELDVAEQLAKKPLPRSLHSSLQRAASRPASRPPVDDEETRRLKLEAAKRELLALAGQV
ncbi:uncharacterized protein F4812DRAFT_422801 [Daldinia caldariorum]|uniref:uncharacterized protein n=1 Tax=Daldinia caldariorum TaxID=326644 RepID=UPI002008BD75|nr:uncharacterized protein F4812DRAFT_422801 [Daldinia caldariorum]KAI1469358.1 hypothetical protein F4812DRAFT_422801 [Daldinia caldariorum]